MGEVLYTPRDNFLRTDIMDERTFETRGNSNVGLLSLIKAVKSHFPH